MMSNSDVTIVCSPILVGKPLCMYRRTAMVCLCICRHPHQITICYESTVKFSFSSSHFQTHFHTCDIYIYIREMNPPWSIKHRGLAYCCTLHIYIYITSVMVCQFLQYLSKYALLSTSCFTTWNEQRSLDMERLMTTQENFYI